MPGPDEIVDRLRYVFGIIGGQDFHLAGTRSLDDVGPSRLVPFLGAHAVAELRIDIFLLHERERLIVAEIMSRTFDAHIGDDIE